MKLYAAQLDFQSIAREYSLSIDFPAEVIAEASQTTDRFPESRRDCLDVEFVTIDPPGSMDLDQAVNIETRDAGGWRVRYAIADVAAFVQSGSALEEESLRRGQTIYLPDEPVRLHPPELSEGEASLLPDQQRPAVVWDIDLDSQGEIEDCDVYRALVRSVARFDYAEVEADMKADSLHSAIASLPAVGRARQQSDLRRDAVNLRLPSVTVERNEDDTFSLLIDPRLEMNDFNAELSLLAGMCAGSMMVKAGVGILRTLPPAGEKDMERFDADAQALGYPRGNKSVGELLATVDASTPTGMALMRDAQGLLRGSGYQAFGMDGQEVDRSTLPIHAGIGGHYAHVTAPLRRLVDRFATEICLAIANDSPVPEWVSSRVDEVVRSMATTSQLASQVDKAALRLTEAVVLADWVGQNFSAITLHSSKTKDTNVKSRIFVVEPPVMGECVGNPPEGESVLVTLAEADVSEKLARFAWPAD